MRPNLNSFVDEIEKTAGIGKGLKSFVGKLFKRKPAVPAVVEKMPENFKSPFLKTLGKDQPISAAEARVRPGPGLSQLDIQRIEEAKKIRSRRSPALTTLTGDEPWQRGR